MSESRIILPSGEAFAIWNGHEPAWTEARVIADPVKRADEPIVLVRRNQSDLVGTRGEQLISLPGQPAISLFTGAGGLDIGLEAAGFCSLVQHEWMQAACQTLIANRPNYFRWAALIQGDIRKTPTSMLLSEAGLRVGEATLVCGGAPCQGFSTSNSNSLTGKYDRRNDLVFEFLRVVREAQPRFFAFENVPGLLSFPGKIDGKTYFQTFLETAYNCYYELVYGLLDACEYGVPQYRCRFFCMGTRRDMVEIDGMLASLPGPRCFGQRDLDRMRLDTGLFREETELLMHAPGVRYFPDRPVLIPPAPVRGEGRNEAFLNFYRKLEREEPDRIVRAPKGGLR